MNYTEEYLEQIDTALEDEDFCCALLNTAGAEEVISVFAGKGIELDMEIAQAMIDKLNCFKSEGELSREELDMVAGGKNIFRFTPTGPFVPHSPYSWLRDILNNYRIPSPFKRKN